MGNFNPYIARERRRPCQHTDTDDTRVPTHSPSASGSDAIEDNVLTLPGRLQVAAHSHRDRVGTE
jgi:hypothetical protein